MSQNEKSYECLVLYLIGEMKFFFEHLVMMFSYSPNLTLSSPLGFPNSTHQYIFHYLPIPMCLLLSPSRLSNFLLVTSISLFLPKFLTSPNFANSRCWFPEVNELEGWILGVELYNRLGKMHILLELVEEKNFSYVPKLNDMA